MPLSRLPVWAANSGPVPVDQGADGRVAVHGLEHLETSAVHPHNGEIVVERGKPPFIGMVLIGNQIGNVPGEEVVSFSCQMARFVYSDGRLHGGPQIRAEAYTSRPFSCNNLGAVVTVEKGLERSPSR